MSISVSLYSFEVPPVAHSFHLRDSKEVVHCTSAFELKSGMKVATWYSYELLDRSSEGPCPWPMWQGQRAG